MHKSVLHKDLQDPFAHYTRGVLSYDEGQFTFIAYRLPYQGLNDRTWKSERAFTADYRRMVAKKYMV